MQTATPSNTSEWYVSVTYNPVWRDREAKAEFLCRDYVKQLTNAGWEVNDREQRLFEMRADGIITWQTLLLKLWNF